VSKRQEMQRIIVCLEVKRGAVYATVHFGSGAKKSDADKTND
jgi:imidazole glycerol phosphate synthase subunit HisF